MSTQQIIKETQTKLKKVINELDKENMPKKLLSATILLEDLEILDASTKEYRDSIENKLSEINY